MAGVDVQNKFPNSKMAQAVKAGASRMVSSDVPNVPMGEQANVNIAVASTLTLPAATAQGFLPTYAVVTAIGGTLYYTIDGSVPTIANSAGQVAAGSAIPLYGTQLLQAIKVIGTTMSVAYYR